MDAELDNIVPGGEPFTPQKGQTIVSRVISKKVSYTVSRGLSTQVWTRFSQGFAERVGCLCRRLMMGPSVTHTSVSQPVITPVNQSVCQPSQQSHKTDRQSTGQSIGSQAVNQ